MEYKIGQVITINTTPCVISHINNNVLHVINNKGEVAKVDITKIKIKAYNHSLSATIKAICDGIDYIVNNDKTFMR